MSQQTTADTCAEARPGYTWTDMGNGARTLSPQEVAAGGQKLAEEVVLTGMRYCVLNCRDGWRTVEHNLDKRSVVNLGRKLPDAATAVALVAPFNPLLAS